jgi:3-methyl-2-oxobutanoate hydroxymethyltransferase
LSELTVPALQAMKREGRKIVAVVAWDEGTARTLDEAGVDMISVGDSGAASFDELLVFCAAVRRGTHRAVMSCDLPEPSVEAARRLADAGADLVKVEGVENVRAIAAAGIAVFAQIASPEEAAQMEDAGAALIDFRHSGPQAGAAAVAAVSIPVVGGLGGGPWLDGRMRMAHAAIGYAETWIDTKAESYANVAKISLEALSALIADVRAGRQIKS